MRKILCYILCVVFSLTFMACDSDNSPTKQASNTSQKSEITEDETYSLNESAVFTDLKFTATEIKESIGNGIFVPQSDNVFVGIKFDIENISDEEQHISSLLLFEGYVDDVKVDYSLNAACDFNEGTIDGSIAPGKKLIGWYALEVPSDWKNIEIHVLST